MVQLMGLAKTDEVFVGTVQQVFKLSRPVVLHPFQKQHPERLRRMED